MSRFFVKVVFLLSLLPCLAQAALFDANEFYLDNGMRVIVVENHKAPIAKFMVWYRVGSIDEPLGQGGLAHLLEHLMFRGTKQVKGSLFNDIIAKHGGDSNAFTTKNFTAYHEFMDISRLEVAMALEADRMVNLELDHDAVYGEKEIVKDERRQRVMLNPIARFREDLNRVLWQGNAQGRPVSGSEDEISALTLEQIKDFYRHYYAPNNAVMVIAGDITVEQAKVLAQKYFGSLKASQKIVKKDESYVPSAKTEYRLVKAMENVETPRIIREYIVPSIVSDQKPSFALMLFADFLASGDNSYFNQNLVLKKKATAASASVDVFNRGAGVFTIMAVPYLNNTVEQTEKWLNEALLQALQTMNDEDLKKLKTKNSASLVYVRDNPQDAAYIVGNVASLGLSLEDIENYEAHMNAVTLEDIHQAVEAMLDQSTNITGVVLPYVQDEEKK